MRKEVEISDGIMQDHLFIEPEKMQSIPVVLIEDDTPQDKLNQANQDEDPQLPLDQNAFKIINKQYQ